MQLTNDPHYPLLAMNLTEVTAASRHEKQTTVVSSRQMRQFQTYLVVS